MSSSWYDNRKPERTKEDEQSELAAKVAEFLERGGQIKTVEAGVSAWKEKKGRAATQKAHESSAGLRSGR